ncbi:hypothetical protein HU200_010443 [Digitaria exilis]|uniref:Mediator complex subunit 4 n=1 Tax=Digitaria exilis TaxID=1010633 RepID=A0A835FJC6_9POAL|nr:hypothetical protein HU200_010443 [Digitaria exilis]
MPELLRVRLLRPPPPPLGLPASSPSLPPNPSPLNPTSSPPQGNLPASAAAGSGAAPTLTTSPPLLQLISSLASNLFELSPNRAAWISAFRGSLPNFLPSASSSAPPPLPTPISSTKDALSLLTTLQTQLFEAVAELQETLDLQDARARRCAASLAKKLHEAHHVLDRLVDDYADYRRDPKRPRGAAAADDPEPVSDGDFGASLRSRLKLDDILVYAHHISYTTFAPPEHSAGVPLRLAAPPAPQESEMRASKLYLFADMDVGVPKKPLEAKEGITAEVEAMPLYEPPQEGTPRLPSTLPPMFDKNLKPPPGWKPGDPIDLPLDDILPPVKGEEPQAPVPRPPVSVRPPIQVKAVQLDFESSSSDEYSSDVGSSEEDDED